jgi:hypothetical protein
MFASVVVSDYVYETLSALSEVTSVIPPTRMTGAMAVPEGTGLPALLFHMTASQYGGPVQATAAENVNSETIRLEVRAIDDGTSDSAIYPAAMAQFEALSGTHAEHTLDGDTYSLDFIAVGEIPITTLVDGANFYRQLGTIYQVDVFRA